MAPNRRPVAEFGSVSQHGTGARIMVWLNGKLYTGPTRASRRWATCDLLMARKLQSREQMCLFVQLLHNGHCREHLRGYQKILSKITQMQSSAVAKAAKVKKPLRAKRRARSPSKIKACKRGVANRPAGTFKSARTKDSPLQDTTPHSSDGKKLLLQLKRCHYEAIMAERKLWEARPLLDKTGKHSKFAKLGTVGRIVILQSGRGTNSAARITDVRRYLGEVDMPPIKEMLLDLGAELLPDSPPTLKARISQYAECYSEGWDLDKMPFVALRLELGKA